MRGCTKCRVVPSRLIRMGKKGLQQALQAALYASMPDACTRACYRCCEPLNGGYKSSLCLRYVSSVNCYSQEAA